MWLFRSLQRKSFSLPEPTPKLLFLLVFLQLAAWYPTLKQLDDDVDTRTRELYHDEGLRKQRSFQVRQLQQASFLDGTKLTSHLQKSGINSLYEWQLSGTSTLVSWQSVLENAQKTAALSVTHVEWERQNHGLWKGKLKFDVFPRQYGVTEQNFLPENKVMPPMAVSQWQLISIMKQGNEAPAALLQYQEKRFWVTQGDWLPKMGLSVESVSSKNVSLISTYGDTIELSLYQQGESHG